MENAILILKQILVMFCYMAIGCALYKTGRITKEGSASLANLLLYAVLPAVVLNSLAVSDSREKAGALLMSLLAAAILLAAAMLVSHLLFRKNPVNDFGAAFSNAGFMGFPLISALLGQESVFYAVGFVALLNALQWTYGQYLMSGDRNQLRPMTVLRNPLVLSLLLGLILFFSGIQLPPLIKTGLAAVASMNAPLAMIILGIYLAQMDVIGTLSNPSVYLTSAVRLVVIPLLSLAILHFMPMMGTEMKTALYLAAMAPVGSNVAVYAQKQGRDFSYAVGLVCVSTILSLVTMPLLILLIGG